MTIRAEQETIIRWDEDDKIIHVFSASPVTWRKMARLGFVPTRETTRNGEPSGKFYTLPPGALSWGKRRAGVPGQGFGGRIRQNPATDGASDAQNRDSGAPSDTTEPEA